MSNKIPPHVDYTRYEAQIQEILKDVKKLILMLPLDSRRASAKMVYDMWYELETEVRQEIHHKIRSKSRDTHT